MLIDAYLSMYEGSAGRVQFVGSSIILHSFKAEFGTNSVGAIGISHHKSRRYCWIEALLRALGGRRVRRSGVWMFRGLSRLCGVTRDRPVGV